MKTYPLMNKEEFAVIQPPVNDWNISWNPDDDRWYVEHPITGESVSNFKDRRNVMQYARNHDVQ